MCQICNNVFTGCPPGGWSSVKLYSLCSSSTMCIGYILLENKADCMICSLFTTDCLCFSDVN